MLFAVGEGAGINADELEYGFAGMVDESDGVIALGKCLFGLFKRYEYGCLGGDVGTHHAGRSDIGELHGVGDVGVDGYFTVDDVAACIAVDFLLGEVKHELYALVAVGLTVDCSDSPCTVEEVHIVLAEHHDEMAAVIEQVEIVFVAVARNLVRAHLVESSIDEMFERGVGTIFLCRHHACELQLVAFAGDGVGIDDVAAVVTVDTSLRKVEGDERALFAGDFLPVDIIDIPLTVKTYVGRCGRVILYFLLSNHCNLLDGRGSGFGGLSVIFS